MLPYVPPEPEKKHEVEPARPSTPLGVAACAAAAGVLQFLAVLAGEAGPGADSWAGYYHDSAAGFRPARTAPVVVGTVGALAALFAPRIVAFALGALIGLGASGAALHGGVLVRRMDFSGSADRRARLCWASPRRRPCSWPSSLRSRPTPARGGTPTRVGGLASAVGWRRRSSWQGSSRPSQRRRL